MNKFRSFVFIYCNDTTEHRDWANGYSKIRGVYNRPAELVGKIQHDVQFLRHHFTPANIFPLQDVHQTSFHNIDKDKTAFLWFQLLIDVLARLPKSEQNKRDLIDECRKCYSKDAKEQQNISDFESNDKADQAVACFNKNEGEVLFGMGSVFRIVDVAELIPNISVVNLTLLETMGQFAQAKRYCELILREDPSDEEKMHIYTHLCYYECKLEDLAAAKRSGKIALGEYQDALTYHQTSIEMERKTKIKEDEEMSIEYMDLGMTYWESSKFSDDVFEHKQHSQSDE
ncbi:unnamed protein product [Rotaria socialis]|uniref:Tetratricopeptide repeat protein n=1 Tax=Rotaria socialis TaxID=392032 RepID=A0A821E3U0_9BILA|nr:unnamed protein product [Rotaria socialis]